MSSFRSALLLASVLMLTLTVSACSGEHSAPTEPIPVADLTTMPALVRDAPQRIAFTYRFAAASADVLQQMPCYCGCGPMGHTSNYACFWDATGKVDPHALECGICVDIAEDTWRGLQQGRSVAEIRQQIDADYSRFGPSTATPPVASVSP